MNIYNPSSRYTQFVSLARLGSPEAVDHLMQALAERDDIGTSKLVDYALSLVDSPAGVERLRYHLFHGVTVQRNFAALYFKRRGFDDLLAEAVALKAIDDIQAWAK